MNQNLFNQ